MQPPQDIVALAEVATAYKVSQTTAFRWVTAGVQRDGARIRLAAKKVGGVYRTTWSDVSAFIEALNEPQTPETPMLRSPARRRRDNERAEKQLDTMRV